MDDRDLNELDSSPVEPYRKETNSIARAIPMHSTIELRGADAMPRIAQPMPELPPSR